MDLGHVLTAGSKAVVFSQHKNVVAHISRVLLAERILHVKIMRGDHQVLFSLIPKPSAIPCDDNLDPGGSCFLHGLMVLLVCSLIRRGQFVTSM